MSKQTKPSIVFVHGLWADGSCFSKVIPMLQAEGYEVIASQHSLDTLEGDVATVKRTLGRVSSPAILVATRTAERSSQPREPMTASPGWSTSPPSRRTLTRRLRANRASSPSQTFSPTSKSRTGASGCARKESCASQETCPSRSRSSSGRPTPRRTWTCLTRRLTAPLGGRSRAGTSWRTRTAPFTRAATLRGKAYARLHMKSTAATSQCSPTPALLSM